MKWPFSREKTVQISVALAFALVAGSLAGFSYARRDFLFEWGWSPPHGNFVDAVPTALALSARDYAEAERPGEECVVKAFGRDERYLFAAIGCGKFSAAFDAPTEGDAHMLAYRLRIRGDHVSSWETPVRGAYENSVRRLFPAVAFERMRYGVPHAEYWAAGAARAKEKGVGASR